MQHTHTLKSAPKMRCVRYDTPTDRWKLHLIIILAIQKVSRIYILMMAYPYLIYIIFLSKVMRIISNLIFLVVIIPNSVSEWISVVSITTAFFSLPLSRTLHIFFLFSHSIPEQFVCSFAYSFAHEDGWMVGLFVIFYFVARDHFEQWWRKEFFHLI